MANPNDATIDIPLTAVPSRGQTGARKAEGSSPNGYFPPGSTQQSPSQNEKSDLIHGRRHAKGAGNDYRGRQEEEDAITQMGQLYDKILRYSVVTRYFLYVLPLALMIAVPIIIGATVAQHAEIGGVRIVWFFTWIEIVWLSVWVSKLFAKLVPHLFMFVCGIVSSGVRKYAQILRNLELPLSLAGWALVSLVTFPVVSCSRDHSMP